MEKNLRKLNCSYGKVSHTVKLKFFVFECLNVQSFNPNQNNFKCFKNHFLL